jgi:hypothetical protein
VRVVVREQAPRCRLLGHFVVHRGRGGNTLHLPRKVRGDRLRPGSYRFIGTSSQREVLDVRVRLVRKRGRLVVRHDRLEDVCATATEAALVREPPVAPLPGKAGTGGAQPQARPTGPPSPTSDWTQSTSAPRFLPPALRTGSPLVRAVLFALLASAIVALAAGSVPDRAVAGSRVAGVVSRRRVEITVAGIGLLAAAVVLLLFG